MLIVDVWPGTQYHLTRFYVLHFMQNCSGGNVSVVADESMSLQLGTSGKSNKKYLVLIVPAAILFLAYFQIAGLNIGPSDDAKQVLLFQDLVGDKTGTWLSWDLAQGQALYVNIVADDGIAPEKVEAARDAILSTETVEISDWALHKGLPGDSSVYFKGWKGALDAAASSKHTKFYIPQQLEVGNFAGAQIIVKLTNDKNPDGLSGYTKSVIDGNHIISTTATIYGAGSLSSESVSTIVRHEFGHVLGLAHSTAPEDLMSPAISTQYPYISGCDVDAIVGLYDGNQRSEVVCRK